jgi:hypothetical protein
MRNPLPRVVRAAAPHNLRYVQVPAGSVRAFKHVINTRMG